MAITIIEDSSEYAAGAAISICQEEDLSAWKKSWPQDTASNTIENFMFDERAPRYFKVYPPADTSAYVEFVYVKEPTDCSTTSSNLGVPDQYASALLYFVLSRALSKDLETPLTARSNDYYQMFREALGLKREMDYKTSPNVANQGGAMPRELAK